MSRADCRICCRNREGRTSIGKCAEPRLIPSREAGLGRADYKNERMVFPNGARRAICVEPSTQTPLKQGQVLGKGNHLGAKSRLAGRQESHELDSKQLLP
jgi:hypothetical protein